MDRWMDSWMPQHTDVALRWQRWGLTGLTHSCMDLDLDAPCDAFSHAGAASICTQNITADQKNYTKCSSTTSMCMDKLGLSLRLSCFGKHQDFSPQRSQVLPVFNIIPLFKKLLIVNCQPQYRSSKDRQILEMFSFPAMQRIIWIDHSVAI